MDPMVVEPIEENPDRPPPTEPRALRDSRRVEDSRRQSYRGRGPQPGRSQIFMREPYRASENREETRKRAMWVCQASFLTPTVVGDTKLIPQTAAQQGP